MKSFSTYITEAFEKPYNWRLMSDKDDRVRYMWTTDSGLIYDASATKYLNKDAWDFNFYAHVPVKKKGKEYTQVTTGETETGDAFRVFATAVSVLKDFIKRKDPVQFEFTAFKSKEEYLGTKKKTSRASLYKKMVTRFARGVRYTVEYGWGERGDTWTFTTTDSRKFDIDKKPVISIGRLR